MKIEFQLNKKKKQMTHSINIEYIKNRIQHEICQKTLDEISDSALLHEFMKCKSVDVKISELKCVLNEHKIPSETISSIITSYVLKIIPPGTEASIRGQKFNNIVKQKILSLSLDVKKFDIQFEKRCVDMVSDEIPDFYIQDKTSKKVIIGMNQLDLWEADHKQIEDINIYLKTN
jgi:hypothetical protein